MTRLPSNETMCKTRDVNEDQPSTVKIVLPQVPFEDKNPAAKAAIEMRKRKYHLAGKRIVDQSCSIHVCSPIVSDSLISCCVQPHGVPEAQEAQ